MSISFLAPHTGKLFEAVSQLECIKPFVLVGGTALSIQLKTRQSEDLDFMRWKQGKNDTLEIGWPSIQHELEKTGKIQDIQVFGFDQVLFLAGRITREAFWELAKFKHPTHQILFCNDKALASLQYVDYYEIKDQL